MKVSKLVTALLPILLMPAMSGCFLFASDDDEDSFEPATEPPQPSVSYGTGKVRYLRTLAIDPITPTVDNVNAAAEFRIVPPPPPGLAFDESDGTLSGTPTEVAAPANHTVSAVNLRTVGVDDDGNPIIVEDQITSVLLCVEVLEAEGPSSVSYLQNPATYNTGSAIVPNVPTVVGLATLFEVDAPLPPGLSLAPTTGIISGVPSQEVPASDFVVTASNPFGSAQAMIRVQVLGEADASSVLTLNNDSTFSTIRRRPARRFSHRTFRTTPAAPVSSAATPDGRFLFISCSDGSLVRHAQTPGIARPDAGTVVGQYPVATEMLMDGAGARLVLLGSGELWSIEILDDGSLGVEEMLPVSDQAFAMDRNPVTDLIYVLRSGAGMISSFTLRPSLAPTGSDVPTPGYPGHIEVATNGTAAFVSNVTGNQIVAFTIGGGGGPLVQRQALDIAGFIGDLESARGRLFVGREAAGSGLLRFDIGSDGALSNQREYAEGLSISSLATPSHGRELYALDAIAREVSVFDLFGSGTILDYRTRVRDGAFELAMLPGPMTFSRTRWVLAGDPAAGSLGALEINYGPGSLTPAATGSITTGNGLAAVVMNEGETDVYAANQDDDTISHFAFDATNGALTSLGQVASDDGPVKLALDRSERFLFALHQGATSLQRFDIAADGSLVPAVVTTLPIELASNLAFDPTGQFLYVLDRAGAILPFEMDPATGNLTARPGSNTGGVLHDLGFAITGRFMYASSSTGEVFQFAINGMNGSLIALNPASVPTGLGAGSLVAHTRVSTVVVACTESDEVRVYNYDTDTGLLAENTNKGPLFVYNRPVEVLFDFDETYIYVANDDPSLPSLRTWCWVCNGIPSEESPYDGGGRLPVLFAGSGMGD